MIKATSPHAHTAVGLVDLCAQAQLCWTGCTGGRSTEDMPCDTSHLWYWVETCAVIPGLQLHCRELYGHRRHASHAECRHITGSFHARPWQQLSFPLVFAA